MQVFAANLKAIEQLRASRMFRRALRLALSAGNFLNHGSRLGNAIGFRLKTLPKLQDTKWVCSKRCCRHGPCMLAHGGADLLPRPFVRIQPSLPV